MVSVELSQSLGIMLLLLIIATLVYIGVKIHRNLNRKNGESCAYGIQCASNYCQNEQTMGGVYGYMPTTLPVTIPTSVPFIGGKMFNMSTGGGSFGKCSATVPVPPAATA